MAEEWYYAQHGRQLGPVSQDVLIQMLGARRVAPTDLVWKQGMADWAEARTVAELTPPAPAPATPVAPLIQAPQPPGGAPQAQPGLQQVQPGLQQVQYLNPKGMQWDYAGFWLRFVAYVIDYIVLLVPTMILNFATGRAISFGRFGPGRSPIWAMQVGGFHNVAGIVMFWLYYALMESSVHQATLGKMALGLIVTDELGNRLTFGRATGRAFGMYISSLTLGIGYIMAGFTQKKQALHDLIAKCLVVRKDVNRPQ